MSIPEQSPSLTRFRAAVADLRDVPSFIITDLPPHQVATLIRLYTEQPLPVDKLPYSRIFECMVDAFNEKTRAGLTAFVIFGYLVALRKGGRLPLKKG
jgi:hypothetical protein